MVLLTFSSCIRHKKQLFYTGRCFRCCINIRWLYVCLRLNNIVKSRTVHQGNHAFTYWLKTIWKQQKKVFEIRATKGKLYVINSNLKKSFNYIHLITIQSYLHNLAKVFCFHRWYWWSKRTGRKWSWRAPYIWPTCATVRLGSFR